MRPHSGNELTHSSGQFKDISDIDILLILQICAELKPPTVIPDEYVCDDVGILEVEIVYVPHVSQEEPTAPVRVIVSRLSNVIDEISCAEVVLT